jgi:hypothetical protein
MVNLLSTGHLSRPQSFLDPLQTMHNLAGETMGIVSPEEIKMTALFDNSCTAFMVYYI